MPDSPLQWILSGGRAISTGSEDSLTGFAQLMGNLPIPSASAWPTANLAIAVEFQVQVPALAVKMAVVNGGTVSGNLDLGIYDQNWNLLVSKGSTAQAGTSAIQVLDITDTLLDPGTYFMALAADNTTGLYNATTGGDQRLWQVCGVQQMAAAFVLPSTFTPANPGQAYLPTIAVLLDTVV